MTNKICFNIWNNTYIEFDSIEVYYILNDILNVQVFDNISDYPDQVWYASSIVINTDKIIKYYNMYITISNNKNIYIIE